MYDCVGNVTAYDKSGRRTTITYPDSKIVSYRYDELGRLKELVQDGKAITYGYDVAGYLNAKSYPNGMETSYSYNVRGQIESLIHSDNEGILDSYTYAYDILGNKIGIEKTRRGLESESGMYTYGYDAMGRLESVAKDGNTLRCYGYDAFGNRTSLTEAGSITRYAYNALNQLISKTDSQNETAYRYDRRGNLDLVLENGLMKNEYVYGAINRLEEARNNKGEVARYIYNGLGNRVGKETGKANPEGMSLSAIETNLDPVKRLESANFNPTGRIDYVIDMTREYHNLLQRKEDGHTQTYLWDGNVAGMVDENHGMDSYYLQDEMGSPIRLMDETGIHVEAYGYDEFGQDLYGNQGEIQPFGYTGYQADRVAETYFAQAREYRASEGRFGGRDKMIYSSKIEPCSWNLYIYCKQSPIQYVDLNGHETIVVSGGPADSDEFGYQFIETALKDINDLLDGGVVANEITWMVTTAGYELSDLENFAETAKKMGINYVEVDDKNEMVNYINNEVGGVTRSEDLITRMSFYAHGQCPVYSGSIENQLSFAYNIAGVNKEDINFTQSDIDKLEPEAFLNTLTYFYSCNAGTKDATGMSFAQAWSNKTGGVSYGIENGRTMYAMINYAAEWGFYGGKLNFAFSPEELIHWFFKTDLWNEKKKRKVDRLERGYSEYGSLNYPWLVSLAGDLDVLDPERFGLFSRGWKRFEPELCDVEE